MTRHSHKVSRLTVILLLMLMSVSTMATDLDKRDKQIAQIMELSGAIHTFDQMPAMMQTMLQQQPPPLSARELESFSRVMTAAFSPEKMRAAMKSYLTAHYEPHHFSELLALLQRPLVKRMTALEQATTDPDDMIQFMQQANTFMSSVANERLTVLRNIDNAMIMSETMLDLQVQSFQSFIQAINTVLPEPQQMPASQMEEISRQMREQGLYPIRQQMLVQLAWTYRMASDADLNDYLELYRSPIGQWSKDIMKASTLAVFGSATEEISQQIKQKIIRDHGA